MTGMRATGGPGGRGSTGTRSAVVLTDRLSQDELRCYPRRDTAAAAEGAAVQWSSLPTRENIDASLARFCQSLAGR
jgi:hypothetical protein